MKNFHYSKHKLNNENDFLVHLNSQSKNKYKKNY